MNRGFHRWRPAVLVLMVSVLGAGGIAGWRWLRFPNRVQAALPARPDLSGAPKLLRDAVATAEARIVARARALEPIADLGRIYHANGFGSQAEACWRFLRTAQPQEPRWAYYLADIRRAASDYPAVQSLLEETTRRSPNYAPAWLQLAAHEFKSGASDAAEKHFRQRLALVTGDPHARLGLARIALQRGQHEAARHQLEQLVHDSPQFPPGQNLLAELFAAEGNREKARHHRWLGREAGRFKDPEDPWLTELQAWCHDPKRLSVLGTIEFQTQSFEKARALLERAVALAPDDLSMRTLLAELYLKIGAPVRARELLEAAMRDLKPSDAKPPIAFYVTLSDAHRAQGATADALASVTSGLAIFPDAAELHRQRGVILAGSGRAEDAIAAFREAVARNPNDADASFQLGIALFDLGRREDGRAWLQRALSAQPTHPQALTLLARIEMEAGRLDAAWSYLEPLYDSNSGLPQVRQLVGRWHWLAGNVASSQRALERAENYFRAGVEVCPGDAELQASLGVLYLTQGRFTDALAPLEAYHRLQPENARSALFLGQAYASVRRIEEARRVLILGEQLASRAGQSATAENCREILRELSKVNDARIP